MKTFETLPSIEALNYVANRLNNDWRIDAQCAIENPASSEHHLSNGRKAKAVAEWLTAIIAGSPPEDQAPARIEDDDDCPF